MPLPCWLGRINRRIFNPREIRRDSRPVLTHIGRRSEQKYRTPLDAHPVEGGYIFFPLYGADCDWLRNVLAAGAAQLRVSGSSIDLTNPRMIGAADALPELPAGTKPPPRALKIAEFLRMDVAV